MKSFSVISISHQPIRKDFKAPYVASALIYDNVVGFCLRDFCSQIIEQYKKNSVTNLSPEFIFSKLVMMLSKNKYRHHGRKLSLELMLFMNSPYRPWYICDKDPEVIQLLNAAGIDLSSDAYKAFSKIVKGAIQHPYLALVLNQHLSEKIGIKSFYDLDAFTLVGNIRHLINKKCLYRTCVEIGYFKRDEVLLQLFEYLVEALDGYSHAKYNAAIDQFSKDLHYILGTKSQLLILRCYSMNSPNGYFKSSTHEFERSINYSTKNDYKVPFYRLVASTAINDNNWSLFDTSLAVLKAILGETDSVVKTLQRNARVKQVAKDNLQSSSDGYQAQIAQGLELERVVRDVSFMREVEYYRSYHLFSPTYLKRISINEVSTECLIDLVVMIEALGVCRIKRSVLDRVAIQSMYPEDTVTWRALSGLIGSKVVKLDLSAFEEIHVKALDNIEAYFGMGFTLNIEELQERMVDKLQLIKSIIKTRPDLESALLSVWCKYVESHFYAAIGDYASKANYELDKRRDIGTQFKINLRKNKLSANTLRLVVYQSIARSVKVDAKTTGAGLLKEKNSITLNLTRYLNEAVQGGFDEIPSLPKNPNTPVVEKVLMDLTGLNGRELYNYKPNANFLPKVSL